MNDNFNIPSFNKMYTEFVLEHEELIINFLSHYDDLSVISQHLK